MNQRAATEAVGEVAKQTTFIAPGGGTAPTEGMTIVSDVAQVGSTFCETCGSAPCSCHLCIDCGDDAPRDTHGRCVQCTHGYACDCDDCYRGPDRLVDENGAEI